MRIQNKAHLGEGGFSILELLIVVVVLTIGLLAFGSFSGVITDRNENSRKMTIASTLAQDKLEYFKNLSLGATLSNALNGTETVNASGVAGRNGNLAGVAIGLVLTMDILMGGSLTGASMNPARTFGPALALGDFSNIWVYMVGALVGGAAAALLYDRVFMDMPVPEGKK